MSQGNNEFEGFFFQKEEQQLKLCQLTSVTPKTAGILSTAKTTSEISTATMHTIKGVAFLTPSTKVKNLSPSK